MAVPSRRAAAAILLALDPPPWLLAHVIVVAEVAAFLAERTAARGVSVDRAVVEAAALLHDVDKLLPADHPVQELGHGEAGARWLTQIGHGELSRAVAAHPVTRLLDADRYGRWNGVATREERIVAYADKRAGQHLEPMKERFADWERRYPRYGESLRRGRARAERLEREVCETAGVSPLSVRRLRWVSAALDAARHAAGQPRPDGQPVSGDLVHAAAIPVHHAGERDGADHAALGRANRAGAAGDDGRVGVAALFARNGAGRRAVAAVATPRAGSASREADASRDPDAG